MIENSKDVFFFVLSFCILGFTIFICWAIYYIAMILKNVNDFFKEMRKKLALIEELINTLKTKLEKSSHSLALIAEGAKHAINFVKDRNSKKKAKTTSKKNTEN